jgi:NADP-dependent 3-hydroxy acid dehydrogenase YdfG
MMGSLERKTILVAGASSGMGRATARMAGRMGAQVALVGRRQAELDAAAADIGGGNSITIAGDATNAGEMAAAVEATLRRYGRIDALINCVGTNIRERALTALSSESWQSVIESNLTVGFNLTQAVLPTFRRQCDGLIVHVASSAAKKPDLSGAAYQAAKAGIVGLAHATMEEERQNGIRVSVVFPGLTDTPLVEKRPTPVPPEVLANAMQPDDVAQVCLGLVVLPARAHVPELLLYPSRL